MSDRADRDEFDVRIGALVRSFRTSRGVSLETLGKSLGVTYQQVQKYETGANRISASTLSRIARFLGVSITVFFEDEDTSENTSDIMPNSQCMLIARNAQRLDPVLRDKFAGLLEALAHEPRKTSHSDDR